VVGEVRYPTIVGVELIQKNARLEPAKGIWRLIRYPREYGGPSMNTSERFLKFAAECELMAKFTPSHENEIGMASHGREMGSMC
jgi:hypothetical protein